MYERLLSYRYYRLRNQTKGLYEDAVVNLRLYIKSIYIIMKEQHFNETDPITVFKFLMHFAMEADKLNMSGRLIYPCPSTSPGETKPNSCWFRPVLEPEWSLFGPKLSNSSSAHTRHIMLLRMQTPHPKIFDNYQPKTNWNTEDANPPLSHARETFRTKQKLWNVL